MPSTNREDLSPNRLPTAPVLTDRLPDDGPDMLYVSPEPDGLADRIRATLDEAADHALLVLDGYARADGLCLQSVSDALEQVASETTNRERLDSHSLVMLGVVSSAEGLGQVTTGYLPHYLERGGWLVIADECGRLRYLTAPTRQVAVDALVARRYSGLVAMDPEDVSSTAAMAKAVLANAPAALRSPNGELRDLTLALRLAPDSSTAPQSLYVHLVRRLFRASESENPGAPPLFRPCHLELIGGRHQDGFYDVEPLLADGAQQRRIAALLADWVENDLIPRAPVGVRRLVLVGFSTASELLCRKTESALRRRLSPEWSVEYRVVTGYRDYAGWKQTLAGVEQALAVPLVPIQTSFETTTALARQVRRLPATTVPAAACVMGVVEPTGSENDLRRPGGYHHIPIGEDELGVRCLVSITRQSYAIEDCPQCKDTSDSSRTPVSWLDPETLRPWATPELTPAFSMSDAPLDPRLSIGVPLDAEAWEFLAHAPGTIQPQTPWDVPMLRRYVFRWERLVCHLDRNDDERFVRYCRDLKALLHRHDDAYIITEPGSASSVFAESIARRIGAEDRLLTTPAGNRPSEWRSSELGRRIRGKPVVLVQGHVDRAAGLRRQLEVVCGAEGNVVALCCFVVRPTTETLTEIAGLLEGETSLRAVYNLLLPVAGRRGDGAARAQAARRREALGPISSPALSAYLERGMTETNDADPVRDRRRTPDPPDANYYERRFSLARVTEELYRRGRHADIRPMLKERSLFVGPRADDSLRGDIYRRLTLTKALLDLPFGKVEWARREAHGLLEADLRRYRVSNDRIEFFVTATESWLNVECDGLDDGDREAVVHLLRSTIKRLGQLHATVLFQENVIVEMLRIASRFDARRDLENFPDGLEFVHLVTLALRDAANRWSSSLTLEKSLDALLASVRGRPDGPPLTAREQQWLWLVYAENTAALRHVLKSPAFVDLDSRQEVLAAIARTRRSQGSFVPTRRSVALGDLVDALFTSPNPTTAQRRTLGVLLWAQREFREKTNRDDVGDKLKKQIGLVPSLLLADAVQLDLVAPGRRELELLTVAQKGTASKALGWSAIRGALLEEARTALKNGLPRKKDLLARAGADASSLLCLPLVHHDGRKLGVLTAWRRLSSSQGAFVADDLRWLALHWRRLSQLAHQALEAGMAEESQERQRLDEHQRHMAGVTEKMKALLDDGTARKSDDMDAVVNVILDGWRDLLGAESATLWYYDERNRQFVARATRGYDIRALDLAVLDSRDCLLGTCPWTTMAEDARTAPVPAQEPSFYIEDFHQHAKFRHPNNRALANARDMLVIPIETARRGLVGCVSLYLPTSARIARGPARERLLSSLGPLSVALFTLLERSMFAECLDAMGALQEAVPRDVSYRDEHGYFNDVTRELARHMRWRHCHVFYAEDRENFCVAGTTLDWSADELKQYALAAPKWPRCFRPGANGEVGRGAIRLGWTRQGAVEEHWPEGLVRLLTDSEAEEKDVLVHLERDGDTGRPLALVVAVGPRVVTKRLQAHGSARLSVEDARKLKVVVGALLGAVHSRLQFIGKNRVISMHKHGVKRALHSAQTELELLQYYLASERHDSALRTAEYLERQFDLLRMTTLISDLYLAIARGEGDQELSSPIFAVKLIPLLEDTVNLSAAEAAQAKTPINIINDLPRDADIHIAAREDAARLVFHNVVDNAIKYSFRNYRNGVVIRVQATRTHAVVRVVDHGVGVPESYRELIFGPFVRGPVDDPRYKRDGMGLGLYLVKCIVEAHGGSVSLDSKPPPESGRAKAHIVTVEIRWPIAHRSTERTRSDRTGGNR